MTVCDFLAVVAVLSSGVGWMGMRKPMPDIDITKFVLTVPITEPEVDK